MDYNSYREKASMAYAEKTLNDRKSYLRLFDIWVRCCREGTRPPEIAVGTYKSLNRTARQRYEFSDCEPQGFDEISEFIFFLYNDLDYSRVMCRHYFDAIQSYCDTLNLEVYDRERFKQFRDENLQTTTNPNFDSTSVFTLAEIERLVSTLGPPERDFVVLQYIHCRRPGEVKELQAEDIHLDKREVIYPIKKQKYGEDNRRAVDIVNEREYQYLGHLKSESSGLLFPTAQRRLESVRKPFRDTRDRLGIAQLPLKNLRHTRISQLKSVGWEPEQVRDTYTHHKQLSTLQDKYLSSVDETLTEEQLWGIVPTVGRADRSGSDRVDELMEQFGLED